MGGQVDILDHICNAGGNPMKTTTTQRAFVERALASAEQARKTGKYVSAKEVLAKLQRKLAEARKRAI